MKKFTRNLLYTLKRRYGSSGDYYRVGMTVSDVKSGVQTTAKIKYHIKRMIFLPTKLEGNMKIVGAYSTKLSRQEPGLTYDTSTTLIIVDKKDLPLGFTSNLGDYIINRTYNRRTYGPRKRYNIQKVEELEDNTSLLITALFISDGMMNVIYDSSDGVDISEKILLGDVISNQ